MADEKQALLSIDPQTSLTKARYVLVIHGGAGTMSKERSTPEQRAQYKSALSNALRAGYAVLNEGGEAMDAAVAAVASMEGMQELQCSSTNTRSHASQDCPLFNSGKGAVFNVAGKV